MSLGPIMLDVAGCELTAEDRDLLCHPAVGGVILFARNFESVEQLAVLTTAIHGLREPRLLVAVDQEGGRVQRFCTGFTRLPPAGRFARHWGQDMRRARSAARSVGWLMAAELRGCGVDFSFAPVLDLDRGLNAVVGDRAFAAHASIVVELAGAWIDGVREAGMAAVGKHFPGHGGVSADSHTELPVDEREWVDLWGEDLVPFERLIGAGLEAVMPAHVVYSRLDPEPAGFSAFWIGDVLRGRLGFEGVVFSDDLSMAAAEAGGDHVYRARAAARAGCDMLLICNNRSAAIEIVDAFGEELSDPTRLVRLLRMHGRGHGDRATLHEDARWRDAVRAVATLEELESLELPLDDPTEPGGEE